MLRHYLFLLSAIAFTMGCASLWFFHQLPFIPEAAWLAVFCAALALFFIGKNCYPYFILILFYAMGFFYCYAVSSHVIHQRLPHDLEGIPLVVEGTVSSLPDTHSSAATHFEFIIQCIQKYALPEEVNWRAPQKIRLSWYQNSPLLHVGETWQFTVKLKQPHATFNPVSLDYEAWLFTHRISAMGYVLSKEKNQLLMDNTWKNPIALWRSYIQHQLEKALAENRNLGLIEALALGVRDHIQPLQWQAMQATGTNHLVAIAGLHVGFVVAFMWAITQFIWRCIPLFMLYLPACEAGIWVGLFAAGYYSALSGFALPTQRALVMLVVALTSTLFRRYFPPWHAYAMSLFGVLFYDPLSVFSESFWLSFIAVAVILFALHGRDGTQHHWKQLLRMQWIVMIGLAPVTMYFFHQISLINLLTNVIVVPWVGFLALPFVFVGVLLLPVKLSLAKSCWIFSAKILTYFWPFLFWMSQIPYFRWHGYVPHLWVLCVAMLGALIFFISKNIPYRLLGLFGFLPLFFPFAPTLPLGAYQLNLLDVGQGLSVLVKTAHHCLVFDTGSRLDDSYDMGESVVLPALQENFIYVLDMMIISHGDNDHAGGAWAVIKGLPVKVLLTSVPERFSQVNSRVIQCAQGQHWVWDGVNFDILSPMMKDLLLKGNNRSCVLHIRGYHDSALLTGDIEKPAEKILLKKIQNQLLSRVLIAPHHGSKTSSSQDFIRAVNPEVVLYSTGYRNKFHFPNSWVVTQYRFLGVEQENTSIEGQIKVFGKEIECTRQTEGHFWNRF